MLSGHLTLVQGHSILPASSFGKAKPQSIHEIRVYFRTLWQFRSKAKQSSQKCHVCTFLLFRAPLHHAWNALLMHTTAITTCQTTTGIRTKGTYIMQTVHSCYLREFSSVHRDHYSPLTSSRIRMRRHCTKSQLLSGLFRIPSISIQ